MPYSWTSAAAVSSWVDNGFDAQSAISAPPALSAIIKFAVSVVTCMQAAIRVPANGFSFAKRSRICASTGMLRPAHSMRFFPSAASAGFAISLRMDVSTVTAVLLFSLVLL